MYHDCLSSLAGWYDSSSSGSEVWSRGRLGGFARESSLEHGKRKGEENSKVPFTIGGGVNFGQSVTLKGFIDFEGSFFFRCSVTVPSTLRSTHRKRCVFTAS